MDTNTKRESLSIDIKTYIWNGNILYNDFFNFIANKTKSNSEYITVYRFHS